MFFLLLLVAASVEAAGRYGLLGFCPGGKDCASRTTFIAVLSSSSSMAAISVAWAPEGLDSGGTEQREQRWPPEVPKSSACGAVGTPTGQ